MHSPEQDTTWSSFCLQWPPPPHRPLYRIGLRSAADRSPLLHWKMKTTLLLDCGEKRNIYSTNYTLERYSQHFIISLQIHYFVTITKLSLSPYGINLAYQNMFPSKEQHNQSSCWKCTLMIEKVVSHLTPFFQRSIALLFIKEKYSGCSKNCRDIGIVYQVHVRQGISAHFYPFDCCLARKHQKVSNQQPNSPWWTF